MVEECEYIVGECSTKKALIFAYIVVNISDYFFQNLLGIIPLKTAMTIESQAKKVGIS